MIKFRCTVCTTINNLLLAGKKFDPKSENKQKEVQFRFRLPKKSGVNFAVCVKSKQEGNLTS